MSHARTATSYAGSPSALPLRSDSPFAASVASDVTMSTMDGDYPYQHDDYYGSLQTHHYQEQRHRTQTYPYANRADDDEDDEEEFVDRLDEDSNHLQTTGSVLEYSDTSEERGGSKIIKQASHQPLDTNDIERQRKLRQAQGVKAHSSNYRVQQHAVTDLERVVRFSSASDDCFDDDFSEQMSHYDNDVEKQKALSNKRWSSFRSPQQEQEKQQRSVLSWVSQLAYSLRSPQSYSRKTTDSQHHRDSSSVMEEYPYQSPITNNIHMTIDNPPPQPPPADSRAHALRAVAHLDRLASQQRQTSVSSEGSPLLGSSYFASASSLKHDSGAKKIPQHRTSLDQAQTRNQRHRQWKDELDQPHTLITLAAAFLQDYEANRPPTFAYAENLGDVTRFQTSLHRFKYSPTWTGFPMMLWAAALCMFVSSALEGFNNGFIVDEHKELHAIHKELDAISTNGTDITLSYRMLIEHSPSDGWTIAYFLTLFMDKRHLLTLLNMIAIFIFAVDIWMRHQLREPYCGTACASFYPFGSAHKRLKERKGEKMSAGSFLNHEVRTSRSEKLIKPLILFCVVLAVENVARLLIRKDDFESNSNYSTKRSFILFSSILKPLVLFYVSSQARDALETLLRIMNIAVRVLIMELLMILMFAAVACRLFPEYDSFQTLSEAWLSLFELSTTVVNPSLWMPMYASSRSSALFFILFVIISVFYLHSLVLSVIFQTYILSAADIHERAAMDREDAVHLAYSSLLMLQDENNSDSNEKYYTHQDMKYVYNSGFIDIELVRETLKLVRPHYNSPKINALVEIVDPSSQQMVDFATFRTKIRQALNASIRTAKNPSIFALCIELIAVAVGIVNFAYVIMVTSQSFEYDWFLTSQEQIGCIITVMAAFELLVRFNPFRIPDFVPLTRLNTIFDGLALIASIISSWGIILYCFGRPGSLEWILMGRSVDMIRTMRFFPIFRDVVRRSGDVIPTMLGPVVLVVTTVHVLCYMGMVLWGGAVTVGAHVGKISDLYDLNNFNSYQEGIVTMFQVLVVNDWHAIAEVFKFADRCSGSAIVYPFFVFSNLVGVSIILNVMTAFFVESFITKLNDDQDGPAEATATVPKDRTPTTSSARDFNFQLPGREPIRKISSFSHSKRHGSRKRWHKNSNKNHGENDPGTDADSETSSISEMFEFDVYEREGYDRIMQNVTGSHYQADSARQVCHYLEVFESLSPHRDTVGYLVCDQLSLERFGNRRFKTKSIGCLEENELHILVTDMHSELLALDPKQSVQELSITRTFKHKRDPSKGLEISAALLRRHPALSVFVSRTTSALSSEKLAEAQQPPQQQQQQRHKHKSKQTRKVPK